MKFGYTIFYVEDVAKAMDFYQKAFNLEPGFFHESGAFGQMKTGGTALAFCQRELALLGLEGLKVHDPGQAACPFEVALVTDDVDAAFERAVGAGASAVAAPSDKPWDQRVAYVRDLEGFLVEICTPVAL